MDFYPSGIFLQTKSMSYSTNKIPKEQRLGYEYRNYHHYAAIILELGTVGKILVTASILDLSNFKFQEFIMMSPIEFYLPGTYPPGTYVLL